MAKSRKGRQIDGIFLLNKGLGVSSNHALQQVRRLFNASKGGHTGALDPLATGMLPICLGEATKFSQFLLDADKKYSVTAKLGIRTTTSDADGEVVESRPVAVTEAQLLNAIDSFKGQSKQVPSMFSALKYQGKPLYHYARQGIDVPREARDIEIFSIRMSRFAGDEVAMEVHCSKGTYIRSLVDDLGQMLGCGAYVSRLDRTAVADYPVERMMTIEALQAFAEQHKSGEEIDWSALDALLLPMDTAVASLPSCQVPVEKLSYFSNGNPVQTACCQAPGQVRAYAVDTGTFLGVAELDSESRLAPKRLVVGAR
ncbi:tRNA pseudouridine(55) synthase TruB [Aliiglaciecola sp. CAU 1673]|uniref:tRNA pseudouridine(55) synthase TruB n=1 Tax=Aliiglaciecola sp. CAU 1673 TaxID=3032595 RepID=UPI0023D99516|nr:tRNA pseudouridine(55) synthase TruB [Aliiglaciecola sp. CAU 1673]MDF2177072.1 tRNA pseudouridine(55) synthase TruB [Aliiglaciecola sp. CAU 1673]